MSLAKSLLNDGRALWHLVAAPAGGTTHQERLNRFYRGQAEIYDGFRKRMLHGRQEMIDLLPVQPDSVWVDIGCGTGENLERFGDRLSAFSQIYLVDLCAPLLNVARRRAHQWTHLTRIETLEADATSFELPVRQVDLVTFSYSLTMIPDWFAAIDRAYALLRPGGIIGVSDFFVSRKHVEPNEVYHHWITRTVWPIWFAFDNVHLSPDRLAMLKRRFDTVTLSQHRGRMAYLPLVRAPYYVFVGRKPRD